MTYDARQYNAVYSVGDYVLAWRPSQKNKLMYAAAAPAPSPRSTTAPSASYDIRDANKTDATPHNASILNLSVIPNFRSSTLLAARFPPTGKSMRKGKFFVVRQPTWPRENLGNWENRIYVGEIYGDCDADNDHISVLSSLLQ